jgi:cysteine-rich repeat protein
VLSSLGPSGVNRVTGRDSTGILGTMRANQSSGRNELVYNGQEEQEPIVLGTVTPAASIIVDASVLPCPACGNSNIEPPETCDDGNQLDGDGCSSTCQVEAGIPGDANGDRVVTPDDVGFLAEEIFDGDGDSVTMVSGGAFPGSPGADANGDDVVTAADLTATLELLVAP